MPHREDDSPGQLERVSVADLAALDQERAQLQASARSGLRTVRPPQLAEEQTPVPEPPATSDLPRWTPPPLVEVHLGEGSAGRITVSLHPARLDLPTAQKAARARVHKLLGDVQEAFVASPSWEAVLELRSRQVSARARLADADKDLAAAEQAHRQAAAGQGDAGKGWKKVLAQRDERDGAAAAVAAVDSALQAAEQKARAALAAAVEQARAAEQARIGEARRQLLEQLLASLKPQLEALATEAEAARQLAQQTRHAPALPA